MKATIPWLGSALVAALAVSAAAAQCPGGHAIHQAPDACGPGYYAPNEYGLWFGPNYNLQPCGQPFNGMVFGPGGPGGPNGAEAQGAPAGPYGPGAPGRPGRRPARPALTGRGAPARPAGPYRPRAAYPPVPGGPYGPNGPGGRMVPYPYGPGVELGQEVPGPASFPTHPWARSPRDFFMADVP